MDRQGVAALIAALVSVVSLIIALKKSPHENSNIDADSEKKKAERDKLYQEIADRWAEHVEELQLTIKKLEAQATCDRAEITGLRLDIQQVRRENEQYRQQLAERDALIVAIQHWAEQLAALLREHAPHVPLPEFQKGKVPSV